MAGRKSRLADPNFAKAVAELYISGMSRKEMAEELNCIPETVGIWCQDPRVQAHAGRLALERVNRITRKIDSEMEARMQHINQWSLDEVLKVRKEYIERAIKVGVDLSDAAKGDTVNEISEAMDQSPEFAEQLRELLSGK